MTIFAGQFATHLIPSGQYGVAFPGGLDFIVHSTQAQIDLFMSQPEQSTHALLLLDIVNMFNAISWDACHSILEQNPAFAPLLPFLISCTSTQMYAGYAAQMALSKHSINMKVLHKAAPLALSLPALFSCLF
jgi:hypothetical protein